MKFENKGLIFKPNGQYGFINSHAQVPTVLVREKYIRVYFSTRQKPGQSLTTFVDLDINNFSNIIYLHDKPIIELGQAGSFDEHGIMPDCVIEHNGLIYLYYSGWQRCVTPPYQNFTGLAISEDGGTTFRRYSKGPIIDRTPFELYSATSCCVYKEQEKWHMYYTSGTHWHKINNQYEHTFDIKYAFSDDGKKWAQTGQIIIKPSDQFEAIARPSIYKKDNSFHMLYCYRGSHGFRNGHNSYKIGYARSEDLITWKRNDSFLETEFKKEWDSEMQAYPCIVQIHNQLYLFYNGNGFGKEGFGYAQIK